MLIMITLVDRIANFFLWMISEEEGRNFMMISVFTFAFLTIVASAIGLSMLDDDDGRH